MLPAKMFFLGSFALQCLGTVGYGQPRLTKAHITWASRLSADLWPVVVGYGWAK
ncbi:hypothetical protein PAXRUDRAFT_834430, partial [Paxillus rubicundulus Ve08.2h10]